MRLVDQYLRNVFWERPMTSDSPFENHCNKHFWFTITKLHGGMSTPTKQKYFILFLYIKKKNHPAASTILIII